jgi:glutamate racemase
MIEYFRPMSYPSILVLDSGVGGLSIAGKIREICRPLQIHYLADLAGFPYGIKSEQEITQRVVNLLEVNLPIYLPKIVVIACNTASTLVLEELRSRFKIPFVGVVPAIKPAASLTQTGVIALLATEATIARDYTRKLVRDFASNQQVILHGSAKLVLLAERKLKSLAPLEDEINREIERLGNTPHLDTVVLACTHFPLLKEELRRALPQVKFWVDSGEAIARRVQYWLDQLGIESQHSVETPTNQFLFNGPSNFEYNSDQIKRLLGEFIVKRVAN